MGKKNYQLLERFFITGRGELFRVKFPADEVPFVGMKIILNEKEKMIAGILFERNSEQIRDHIFDCILV